MNAIITAPLKTLPGVVQRAYRAAGSPELPPLGPALDNTAAGAETHVLGPELSGALLLAHLAHLGRLRAPSAFLDQAGAFFAEVRLTCDRLRRGGAMGPKRRARAQQRLTLRGRQLLLDAEALWPEGGR
jgi:hypothetical protein